MSGDLTRIARYQKIWQRPHGPIRADLDVRLEEFFLEPWYQLLRQQMTAYHAEIDPLSIFDRATLLHISPKDNIALRSAKGELARFGEDAFDVFQEMIDPAFRDRFISMDTSEAPTSIIIASTPPSSIACSRREKAASSEESS